MLFWQVLPSRHAMIRVTVGLIRERFEPVGWSTSRIARSVTGHWGTVVEWPG